MGNVLFRPLVKICMPMMMLWLFEYSLLEAVQRTWPATSLTTQQLWILVTWSQCWVEQAKSAGPALSTGLSTNLLPKSSVELLVLYWQWITYSWSHPLADSVLYMRQGLVNVWACQGAEG